MILENFYTADVEEFLLSTGESFLVPILQALTSNSVYTGLPTLGTLYITHIHTLQLNSIALLTPTIDTTEIAQKHTIEPMKIVTGLPEAEFSRIYQIQKLSATDLLTGSHTDLLTSDGDIFLDSNGISFLVKDVFPVVEIPSISQVCSLQPNSILHPYSFYQTTPVFGQINNVQVSTLQTLNSVIGVSTLAGIHNISPSVVFADSPLAGPPVITIVVLLDSNSIVSGLPLLGTPKIYFADAFEVPVNRIVKILWASRSISITP